MHFPCPLGCEERNFLKFLFKPHPYLQWVVKKKFFQKSFLIFSEMQFSFPLDSVRSNQLKGGTYRARSI